MRVLNFIRLYQLLGRMAVTSSKACRSQLAQLVFTSLALAGFIAIFAGSANAIPCWAVSPNMTRILGPGVPDVESTSNGALYAKSGCHYWVVDISVPSNSSGGSFDLPSILMDSRASFTSNKANCESYRDYILIYVKHPGQSQFDPTPISQGWRKGVWHGGEISPCTIRISKTYKELPAPLNPPKTGTDIYRVAGSARIGESWKRVHVTATHVEGPAR
jgi:hypothetical protein